MLTKPSLTVRRAALGLAPALLVAAGLVAVAAPAPADPAPRCGVDSCDDGTDVDAEDGGASISIWGSATTAGEEGYEIPAETVTVVLPCRYIQGRTGKDYYEFIQMYGNGRDPDGNPIPPYEGYEQYKDDTEGHWWGGMCSSADFDGPIDDFFDYSDGWFDENDGIYVLPGDPIPVPPIPPEILVEVAYAEMTLPDPEIGWNPQRDGDGATFVNVPTWMWLDDGPIALEINAQAGDNIARVEAALGSMNFSAANAAPVSCTGTGVAWTSGAISDCALTFTRSSANQPGLVSSVLAEIEWSIEWFANGEPRGPLDPQATAATFALPVAEVQTIVTR